MSILNSFGKAKIAVVLGVFALAACDETSNITPGFSKGEIVKSTVIYANSKGPVLVEVFGDPFGMRDSVLHEKILGHLDGNFSSPIIRFTTDDDKAFTPNVRFRIAFGWPQNANTDDLCNKDIPDLNINLERLTIAGALCHDGERLSDADGWVSGIQTPDDQKFMTLISDLGRSVLDPSD